MKMRICAALVAAGSLLASICACSAGETLDLKKFGAACNGSHDDTAAIQAWLNNLAANVSN
jgi:polygalacturonase